MVIKFNLYVTSLRQTVTRKLYYTKANYRNMASDINETEWHAAISSVSVDEVWSAFSQGIRATMEQNIPSKQVPIEKECPMCIVPEAKEAIQECNQAWTRFRMSKRLAHFTIYKCQRNEASNKLKMSRRKFENKIASEVKDKPGLSERWSISNLKSKQASTIFA